MTPDDIGLSFFTADQQSKEPGVVSVFGAVDQERMIAHIDDVEDDDLDSSFFSDSMKDVEDAATRAFDVGIRTLTDEPRTPSASTTFGATTPAAARQSGAQATAVSAESLKTDEGARRSFILGGPAGSSS